MRYRSSLIRGVVCGACLAVAGLGIAQRGRGAANASELRRTATVRVVEQARPSIVNIHGQKTLRPSDEGFRAGEQPQRVNGMGTGVVIDPRGYIITNHHVVDGVGKIQVTLHDEKSYVAKLVAHDPKTDLAVIKIDATESLPVITVGTSSDLMPGEPVVAVGNAYGYEHTVTRGIISALHRTVQVSDSQNYQDLIQTDASINPGNSGGPLLNIDGEMIGINVAVRAGAQGIGFAIPVDMAMSVAAKLLSSDHIDNNWHGVKTTKDNVKTRGMFVGEVEADSPALTTGLQEGDRVVSVGDAKVERTLDFERALIGHKAGDDVPLVVERDGKQLEMSLQLAASPRKKATLADKSWDMLGLRLETIPSNKFPQGASNYRGGLMVSAVRPESPASRQGIRRGDVLVGMHIYETLSLENVAWILNQANLSETEPVKFYIVRGKTIWQGHLQVASQR